MAPPPGPRAGPSRPPAKPQPQEVQEEEITDLVAFQASLDDSVSAVRTLVDSWMPKDLDASWDAQGTSSFANASLASRARPPRLGLGASVTALHLQQAEENKLRQRLLSKGKGNKRGAEEEEQRASASGSTANGASNEAGSDDEEEDSRSKAFKAKINGVAPSNGIGGSKASGASTYLSTPKKATSSKPLFNPLTPSQPAPSTSALPMAASPHNKVKKEIAPISLSGTASSTASSTDPAAPLSKNKRKKERERERAEATKRQKLEEVLAEERVEAAKEMVNVVMQSPQVAKHRTVKPPFAPPPSSGGDSPAAEVHEQEKDADDGDDSDREVESVDGSEVLGSGAGNGEGLKRKKKKRRKKKGSKGGKEGGAPKPVLNLGAPQA